MQNETDIDVILFKYIPVKVNIASIDPCSFRILQQVIHKKKKQYIKL